MHRPGKLFWRVMEALLLPGSKWTRRAALLLKTLNKFFSSSVVVEYFYEPTKWLLYDVMRHI